MVKVYFETEHPASAVLVALFESEDIYNACLKSLEEKCKQDGYDFMTEVVTDLYWDDLGFIQI